MMSRDILAAFSFTFVVSAVVTGHVSLDELQEADRGDAPNLTRWYRKLDQYIRDKGMTVTEGHTMSGSENIRQREFYDAQAANPDLTTVCETGFNSGHSALRFLIQSKAKLVEFDLGEHDYAHAAAEFLQTNFGSDRLQVVWGSSTTTLPEFRKARAEFRCDLMIVDGGHTYDIALADLEHFHQMAAEHNVVTMDDAPCVDERCQELTRAWQSLVNRGCLETTGNGVFTDTRGFTVGRFLPCNLAPNSNSNSNSNSNTNYRVLNICSKLGLIGGIIGCLIGSAGGWAASHSIKETAMPLGAFCAACGGLLGASTSVLASVAILRFPDAL